MYNTNITKARAELYRLVDMAINDSEVINISTKQGNAVIIGEDDYNALMETLYLSSNPVLKQILIDGKETSIDDCIDESEIDL